MRFILNLFVIPVFTAAILLAADAPTVVSSFRPEASPTRDFLTNEGLVILSDAGFSDSFIVEKVVLSRIRFDTSPEGLAYLRRNAISEELVQFVMERSVKPALWQSAPLPPAGPMKVVKMKVLVPQTQAIAAWPTAMPMPAPGPAQQGFWYAPSAPPAYAQAGYNIPGFLGVRPAAFSAAGMPVMSAAGSQYIWVAAR